MESFEKKIKERNNLLKSQIDALTGRNELTEVIDTLLKSGVAEEDLVEKAKYIRREADGKGGYKYIYSEPKENKIKTDKVDKKEDKNKNLSFEEVLSDPEGKKLIEAIEHLDTKRADHKELYQGYKKQLKDKFGYSYKSESSDLEKAETDKKKKKVAKVMKEFKAGTLKTSAGEPVKDRAQAIAIAMSEAGMSVKKSTLSTVLKQNESDIEKGKSFPIGTIHNGFKKIAEGKWRKVSEYGMTRIEHESKSINSRRKKDLAMHAEAATKLDSKDYSDEEVVGSDKNSERKVLEQKRKDNRKSYENKEIDYDTYSKNERKLDRKFEKVLKKSEDNDIEKSHLGGFSYSEKLGIKKTGKEIKEKFKINLDKEKSELNELKSKLSTLKTKIGEEPTKKCDYWQIESYEDKGIDIPLVYDYSYMTEKVAYDQAETQLLIGETPKVENTSKLRYEYNEIVRKYIDCQKEILQINTILNNYKDTDVYQLTISQATVLGF